MPSHEKWISFWTNQEKRNQLFPWRKDNFSLVHIERSITKPTVTMKCIGMGMLLPHPAWQWKIKAHKRDPWPSFWW